MHVPFCARALRLLRLRQRPARRGVGRALAGGRRARGRAARRRRPRACVFSSVYLGGGTPSTLEPGQVARLFASLRGAFAVAPDAEVTLEANPESVTPARLAAWRAAGVDRLSLGAQSFHADELARLGRIHAAERRRGGGRAGAGARASSACRST